MICRFGHGGSWVFWKTDVILPSQGRGMAEKVKMPDMNLLTPRAHVPTNRLTGHRCLVVLLAGLAMVGCASTGSSSTSARPVLYPNAAFNRVGETQAQNEVAACQASASAAGLRAEENSQAAQRAGEGAAVAGVVSAVGALVLGRGAEGMLRSGLGGAAIGGAAGATQAAVRGGRPNSVYRSFVQRCLSEKGFDVIGWN
jgi:outer membrane lipoprotein SlyB